MVDFSKVSGQTSSAPPIILQLVDTKQNNLGTPVELNNVPDSFEKSEMEQPISIDPNDKFVINSGQPKEFANTTLGAKYNPEEAKKFGQEAWKWGKRIWGGIELYDTLDGYKDRFTKDDKVQ